MPRVFRIGVLLVLALALVVGPATDAYAGIKDDQHGAVTVEKGPQFMPGAASPLQDDPPGPIGRFPKWTGQYFALVLFFFWLNFGRYSEF